MNSFKYITLAIIAIYLFLEIASIVPQCSGSRKIVVYKRNYQDSTAYIKGYKTDGGSVEQFAVKVMPNGFLDRILLTDDDENILSDVFKIAAAIVFALYIYNLSYDGIFSKKSFNLFWLTLFLWVLSYVAFSVGADHTKDFFTDLYMAKGGPDDLKYDFQSSLKRFDIFHTWGVYYWMPLILINLYKTFNKHHEGEEDEAF